MCQRCCIQLIAIIRQPFSPLVFSSSFVSCLFFYRLFQMNSPLLRIAFPIFFTLQISERLFNFSSLGTLLLPTIFYVCVLKRVQASIVLRKSNRLKKIFFGIWYMMGKNGRKKIQRKSLFLHNATHAVFPAW